MHKTFFQKSDLFFLCMMRPLSFDIQIQESEIDGAQVWVRGTPRLNGQSMLCAKTLPTRFQFSDL